MPVHACSIPHFCQVSRAASNPFPDVFCGANCWSQTTDCDRATVPPCHGSPSSESHRKFMEIPTPEVPVSACLSYSCAMPAMHCYAFIFTDCLEGCQKMEHLPRLHPFPLTEPFRSQPSEKWNGTQVPPKPQNFSVQNVRPEGPDLVMSRGSWTRDPRLIRRANGAVDPGRSFWGRL